MEHYAASGPCPWFICFSKGTWSGPYSSSVARLVPTPGPLDSQAGFSPLCHALESPEPADDLPHAVRSVGSTSTLALMGRGDREAHGVTSGTSKSPMCPHVTNNTQYSTNIYGVTVRS